MKYSSHKLLEYSKVDIMTVAKLYVSFFSAFFVRDRFLDSHSRCRFINLYADR